MLGFAILTLFALSEKSLGVENDQSQYYKNFKWTTLFARVTEYSKKDPHCDPDTLNNRTSTQVPITPACNETGKIGVVAVDPKIVPYGSLVILPNGGKYLAADTGGAVKSRRAAVVLARKEKKPEAFAKAPVLDFYSYQKVVPENWTNVYVLKDTQNTFIRLKPSERKKRLDPNYWERVMRQSEF